MSTFLDCVAYFVVVVFGALVAYIVVTLYVIMWLHVWQFMAGLHAMAALAWAMNRVFK